MFNYYIDTKVRIYTYVYTCEPMDLYVCMYVCMYVCTRGRCQDLDHGKVCVQLLYRHEDARIHICLYICTYGFVCMYTCMYVCMDGCTNGRHQDVDHGRVYVQLIYIHKGANIHVCL